MLGLGLVQVLDVLVVALPPWNKQDASARQGLAPVASPSRSSVLPFPPTGAEEDVAADPFVLQDHRVIAALIVNHLADLTQRLDDAPFLHA